MADLASMPTDIKRLVFGYIDQHCDVEAVYNTCREFYAVMIPLMYRKITISEDLDNRKLSAMLNPDNLGLKYIRHIRIRYAAANKVFKPSKSQVLNMLANHLLRNTLLSLRCV